MKKIDTMAQKKTKLIIEDSDLSEKLKKTESKDMRF